MPDSLHPETRVKEFILDDPGLGWPIKLEPLGSFHPAEKGCQVYRGGISERFIADAVNSCLVSQLTCMF